MRLFFSYGHDENEPIVRALRDDLSALGHEVWVDKYEIKGGDDWRRKISQDILGCDLTIAFASQHSIRRPGVCLDELTIAVSVRGSLIQSILLEKVEPPAAISRRQFFDFSDWKEMKAKGEEVYQAWYEEKRVALIDFLNSDPIRNYAREIDELASLLQPDLSCLKKNLLLRQDYFERPWLLQSVRDWVREEPDSPLMIIQGGPGTGKSLFVANTYLEFASSPAAVFCDWASQTHNTVNAVFRSIIFQLASTQDDYRALLLHLIRELQNDPEMPPLFTSTDDMISELLIEPLSKLIDGNRPETLIIIDGIDEIAADENGLNPLIHLLQKVISRFPSWVRFLLTSRPGAQLRSAFGSAKIIDLSCPNACADVNALVALTLARTAYAANTEEISSHCQENFLLAQMICDELKKGTLCMENLSASLSISDLYSNCFARALEGGRADRRELALLGALAIAPAPLPKETFLRISASPQQNSENLARSVIERFSSCLTQEDGALRLFHKSLADWLLSWDNDLYGVSEQTGWSALASMLMESYRSGIEQMNEFERLYLVQALEQAKSEDLAIILGDETFARKQLKLARKLGRKAKHHDVYLLKKSAMDIYRANGKSHEVLELACDLCDLAYTLVLFQEIGSICDAGIEAARAIGTPAALRSGGILTLQATYNIFRRSDYELADSMYQKAQELFEEAGDIDLVIETIRARGENARFLHSDKTFDYLEQSLSLYAQNYRDEDRPALLIHVLQTLGRAHLTERHDLAAARPLMLRADELMELFPQTLSNHEKGLLEYSVALLHYESGQPRSAIPYLQRSCEHIAADDGKDSVNLCDGLNLLGDCLLKIRQPAKAVPIIRRSYEIRRRAYGNRHLLTCISNLNLIKTGLARIEAEGRALNAEERQAFDTMFLDLLKRLDSLDSEQARFRYGLALLAYGNFLTLQSRYEEARDICDEQLEVFEEQDRLYYMVIALKNRASLPGQSEEERRADIDQALSLIAQRLQGRHPLRSTLEQML